MGTPFLFRFREPLATLPSLLVLAALVIAGVQKATELRRHEDPQPVQIALMELPPPPVPQPKVQTPPPLKPIPVVKQPELPKPVSKPTPAKLESAPIAPATTSSEAPVLPAAQPQPSLPATPSATAAATPAPPAPPTPAAPPPNTANIESQYVAQIRAHLNSIKRYPTGREASQLRPQGRVRVWFVLRRDGSVVDQGIESSSNSMLLDDAARKTINRASFTGFPEGAFGGTATHRFTADLEFAPG